MQTLVQQGLKEADKPSAAENSKEKPAAAEEKVDSKEKGEDKEKGEEAAAAAVAVGKAPRRAAKTLTPGPQQSGSQKTRFNFSSSDGQKTTLMVEPEELPELTVEMFLQKATKRFAEVYGTTSNVFTKLGGQQCGLLAGSDLMADYQGEQFIVMQANEDPAAALEPQGRRQKKGKGFTVLEEPVLDRFGRPTGEVDVVVRIDDRNCSSYLGQLLQNEEGIYKPFPKLPLEKFLPIIEPLKMMAQDQHTGMYVSGLAAFIEERFADTTAKLKALTDVGKISFATLWYLFPERTRVFGFVNDQPVGMTVSRYEYQGGMFPGLVVQGRVIKSDGTRLHETEHSIFIPKFSGAIDIVELPVRPLTDETLLEKLNKRGEAFAKIALGANYHVYHGPILYKTWMGTQRIKADGRVMVDGASFNQMNPNYAEFRPDNQFGGRRGGGQGGERPAATDVAEGKRFMCWPTVGGFSFSAKKWGEIIVENLQPLIFDPKAFERLVLPADQKALIRALVQRQGETISDIIEGKGGGVIFLLFGPPGVGKTLTAESISEYLHRPLYSISVGELGTDARTLEKSLSDVLEVAGRWNAVILLDEADIFLERRTLQDVTRNALVGIFLRLLEYHRGVLFLTSNRVRSFDPAFHSRISIALRYPGLLEEQRKEIWLQLLKFANLMDRPLNVNTLSKYDLNGRQIRTIIKLASALALDEGVPVEQRHFDQCIRVADKFRQDLKQSGMEIDHVEGDLSTSQNANY